MDLSKHIIYKTIFKQDEQTETVEYKAKGVLHIANNHHLSFAIPDHVIDINYNEKEVILKHDQSILKLHKDKEVWNEYQLPYGCVALKTKVLMLKTSEEQLKLKYELYDQSGLISTAYILITMLPLIEDDNIYDKTKN